MASRDDEMRDFLHRAGIEPGAVDSALEIDGVMQQWRRRWNKRELGNSALRHLQLTDRLDLAELDVLMAIWAPSKEFHCKAGQETMVSTVAERLTIDPSRASRLVSELIAKGLARRAVSQQDARRTIVELTEDGKTIVRAVRRYKFLLMGDFLSGWSQEERDTFLPLLARFSKWTEEAPNMASEHFTKEIAALVASLSPTTED